MISLAFLRANNAFLHVGVPEKYLQTQPVRFSHLQRVTCSSNPEQRIVLLHVFRGIKGRCLAALRHSVVSCQSRSNDASVYLDLHFH